MATDMKEAIRRLIYRYVVEGADEVMKTQEKITQQTEKTDKASLSLEKAFSGLERKYVDTVRAQQDYEKVQKKVNDAVAQNPALQERANVILAAAKDKFDNIAAGAGKAGVAATFFSKALTVILGPAGLMGVALTAIGTAAGYMWAKLADQSAITTVEQALEEQNRLLKEGKLLIDAKTSAEAKFNAQPPNVTRFENLKSELDLAKKLSDAAEKMQSRVTTPSSLGMPEMGIAPEISTAPGPGLEKARAAIEDLVLSIKDGRPRVTEFVDELARIAIANPELAQTTQEIIKMGGPALENAVFKARALEAALNGVATAAQLAALGYASLAQFQVGNTMAEQAADATERQAKATLEIAAAYPGMSVEVAKQLNSLQAQLGVAEARTGAEKIVAQEIARQVQLYGEGKTRSEQLAIAAAERRNTEAAVAAEIDKQIGGLDRQYELMKASSSEEAARLKAAHAYEDAIAKGADQMKASQVASATMRNEMEKIAQAEERAAEARADSSYQDQVRAIEDYNQRLARANQLAAELTQHWGNINGVMVSISENLDVIVSNIPQFKLFTDPNTGRPVQFNPEGYTSTAAGGDVLQVMNQIQKDLLGEGNWEERAGLMGISQISPSQKFWDENFPKNTDALEGLTKSTDNLNATMQNILSPYYSQDPRTTKLGFRAGSVANPDWMMSGASNDNPVAAITGWPQTNYMGGYASGGSFTVPGGYSSTDNQLVSFAARSGETVSVATPEQSKAVNIDNRVIINGNVDQGAVDKLKRTQYQQAQRMRSMLVA